ncbi:bifunctional DNA-formamidopyrimidine glycosylase/DNA-(apurinic or apyrimidinic site) lyase [Candidatus Roizmanbacteria bacterium]|jgi:formamidopyrimidine-DNA glycosylase|nr:bifunctional DNA-formamidopyrimidine glycosylase/DNA-(apurinic or apyrimidinic site) lyase [Candidatus Roizmanbacteria bacterium]
MPELPEVESIRRHLKPLIIGKTITSIRILEKKQFFGNPKSIIGQKITALERKGKVMSFKTENGLYMNFHLKLTGQILFSKNIDRAVFKNKVPFTQSSKMPGKTTRIIIGFRDGSVLFFNDLRKFGWIKVSSRPEVPDSLDILDKNFSLDYFKKAVLSSGRPVKILLLDQDKMAGIGNIYANDSLFIAGINPLRKSNSLTDHEINKLYLAIKKIILEGLKHKGSSGADEAFILPDASKGGQQNYFKVYQRENQPCLNCNSRITRIKHGGRSSFFCPKCQT